MNGLVFDAVQCISRKPAKCGAVSKRFGDLSHCCLHEVLTGIETSSDFCSIVVAQSGIPTRVSPIGGPTLFSHVLTLSASERS